MKETATIKMVRNFWNLGNFAVSLLYTSFLIVISRKLLKIKCSWKPTRQRDEYRIMFHSKAGRGPRIVAGWGRMERTPKHNMGGIHYKEERKAGCMNLCHRTAKRGVHEKTH